MNAAKEVLTPEQKADAAEIAAVLRGAPLTAELMCRLTTSAYIAGIKTGRVIAQTAAGQGA